jgi:DNA-directed RNA polymerase subunit RPC12/RpoP
MGIEDYLNKRQTRATHDKMLKKKDDKEDEWKSTICTHCGFKVLYQPRENFKGNLVCPKCWKEFIVPSLDLYFS